MGFLNTFQKKKGYPKKFLKNLFKKGKLFKLEIKTIKTSKNLWRKKNSNLTFNWLNFFMSIRPNIHFKTTKIKGNFYEIPFFIGYKNQLKKTLSWIFAKKTKINYIQTISNIFLTKHQKTHTFFEKKKSIYKNANQNKFSASLRWF